MPPKRRRVCRIAYHRRHIGAVAADKPLRMTLFQEGITR